MVWLTLTMATILAPCVLMVAIEVKRVSSSIWSSLYGLFEMMMIFFSKKPNIKMLSCKAPLENSYKDIVGCTSTLACTYMNYVSRYQKVLLKSFSAFIKIVSQNITCGNCGFYHLRHGKLIKTKTQTQFNPCWYIGFLTTQPCNLIIPPTPKEKHYLH